MNRFNDRILLFHSSLHRASDSHGYAGMALNNVHIECTQRRPWFDISDPEDPEQKMATSLSKLQLRRRIDMGEDLSDY